MYYVSLVTKNRRRPRFEDLNDCRFHLAMLKRLSSLVLVLVISGSVFAGTAGLHSEHVCKMAGMEAMPGMETMPCCKAEQMQADQDVTTPSCCVKESQDSGPIGSTFSPRSPSFSIATNYPAVLRAPVFIPNPGTHPSVTQFFLPNLQATYVRNLSFLI